MSAHTPGPWIVNPTVDDDGEAEVASADLNGEGDYVCSVYAKRDRALIAAAPDLLAALREFMDVCAYAERDGIKGGIANAYEHGRAAIAKAEGKS